MEEEEEKEEDERREAALAATPLFQPNFKSSRVTQAQLDKLRELHRKRLQIKERSKDRGKSKGYANRDAKAFEKELNITDTTVALEDSNRSIAKDETTLPLSLKKRQKLHWGLDTKERWERKANM